MIPTKKKAYPQTDTEIRIYCIETVQEAFCGYKEEYIEQARKLYGFITEGAADAKEERTTKMETRPDKTADKRAVIVIDERFTWPWNVYYNEGGKRKRLPLRLYPSTLWFYVRLVPGKLSRSVRNSLHGLTRFGKSRRRAPSNTRNSRKDGPPSDNPCREAEQS